MDAYEIVTAITERVKDTANVSVVFGDMIETAAGVSIIPVASVKISGGGGGHGRGRKRPEETEAQTENGMGLGVMVTAQPLGYIEVKNDTARFVPTPDITKIAVAGFLLTGLVLMTLNRLMRFRTMKTHKSLQHSHASF
jgi:uncharacterized spore protein YtfJ